MAKIQTYELKPNNYQDVPPKSSVFVNLPGITGAMFKAKYTQDEIQQAIAMGVYDVDLVTRLFKEAETENYFAKYKTSFNLLKHKLKLNQEKVPPYQPPTIEDLEKRKPFDLLQCITDEDSMHP